MVTRCVVATALLLVAGPLRGKDICVEGCTFVRGGAAVAFVGVDGATVRYNTIYRPGRYAILILQEKTDAGFVPCRKGVFENNLVVFRAGEWVSGGVNVGPNTDATSFLFSHNLWHAVFENFPLQPLRPRRRLRVSSAFAPIDVDDLRSDLELKEVLYASIR